MRASVERSDMAKHHTYVAATLENRLETSIFSDDENAIQELENRVAEREAQCARVTELNKGLRRELKAGGGKYLPGAFERLGMTAEEIKTLGDLIRWSGSSVFPAYVNSNKRGLIAADKKRIETIRYRAQIAARAAEAGGVLLRYSDSGRAEVTFADKPERSILDALRAAGFFFSGGSWHGETAKLPAAVRS
jgi:hypothetical protein